MFQSCSRFSFLDTAAAAYILDASGAAAFIVTASSATASGATASGAVVPVATVSGAAVPGATEPSAAVPGAAAVSSFRLSAVTFLLTWAKACWANWAFQSFHDQRDMMVVCGHRLSVESIVASNPLAIFSVAIVVAAVV